MAPTDSAEGQSGAFASQLQMRARTPSRFIACGCAARACSCVQRTKEPWPSEPLASICGMLPSQGTSTAVGRRGSPPVPPAGRCPWCAGSKDDGSAAVAGPAIVKVIVVGPDAVMQLAVREGGAADVGQAQPAAPAPAALGERQQEAPAQLGEGSGSHASPAAGVCLP